MSWRGGNYKTNRVQDYKSFDFRDGGNLQQKSAFPSAFISEDQGTREGVKIGQEEPNQSDNISVAAAPFPMHNSPEVC